MTSRSMAKVAGAAFLVYIAAGLSSLALSGRATGSGDMAARIASVALHTTEMRVSLLLNFVAAFCALLLATSLYSLTRSADRELAIFGMLCRAGEGILGMFAFNTLALLWLAMGGKAPTGEAASAIASTLTAAGQWQASTSALLFAAGSLAFSRAFVRGKVVPPTLARIGVAVSLLLVTMLPLEMAGWIGGTAVYLIMWMPMLAYELWLAVWLIMKGGQTTNSFQLDS